MLTGGASSHQIGAFLPKPLRPIFTRGDRCRQCASLANACPSRRPGGAHVKPAIPLHARAIYASIRSRPESTARSGTMQVVVVGGGIGGLTLGVMLHARGIGCQIYEASPKIRELGVGINVLPHAIAELAELG